MVHNRPQLITKALCTVSIVVHHDSFCSTSFHEGIGKVENFYSQSDNYYSQLFTQNNHESSVITHDSFVITAYNDHSG
jgi:hypothetical protein